MERQDGKLWKYGFFGLLLVCIFMGLTFFNLSQKSKESIQLTPTPMLSSTPLSPTTQIQPSLTPTTKTGSTYYKTEMRCQTNPDCYVCPPQPAGSIQSACQQGECRKGYCYWVHNTDQCQNGYRKVCEAGMCECLKTSK